jgi:hypothetical protein
MERCRRHDQRLGVGGEGDGGHAAGRDADGEDTRGIDLGKFAAVVDGCAEVVGRLAGGAFVVGVGTMAIVEIVGLAARRAVAAAHDDEYDEAAAGEPAGLRKERPRGDVFSRLNLARCAVRDDDQGMFAWEIGVDEERAESVG